VHTITYSQSNFYRDKVNSKSAMRLFHRPLTLNSVRREIVSALTIVSYDKSTAMTSFGLCKVFHYKYNTTGHNFTGHYYVLHFLIIILFVCWNFGIKLLLHYCSEWHFKNKLALSLPIFFLQFLLKIHFKTFTQIPHSQWFIDIGYVNLATKNYGSTWKNDTRNTGFGH